MNAPSKSLDAKLQLHLPVFRDLPSDNDLDLSYYGSADGYHYKPSRHWCLLAEITEVIDFMRIRLEVRDRAGAALSIAFHTNDRGYSLPRSLLKIGNTVAILYANRHFFMDCTVGIRVEAIGSAKIFPKPLGNMLNLLGIAKNPTSVCGQCGKVSEGLPKCGKCSNVHYCNKDCQTLGWKTKHKGECKLMRSDGFKVICDLDQAFGEDFLQFKVDPTAGGPSPEIPMGECVIC